MKVSKKRLIEAVNQLIAGYLTNTLYHRIDMCPLCLIYHNDKAYGQSNECRNCINTIFNTKIDDFGCVVRGRNYKKINFDVVSVEMTLINNSHNANFWNEILDLINSSKITDINKLTPEFKNAVLEIASKYK